MVSARNLFSELAALHGDRLAAVSDRSRATYADLDLKADRLAGTLCDHGVKAGDRVVVFMDDCVEAVVAIAAVLKSGAVLAPIEACSTSADLRSVLDDCMAAALITEARLGPVAAAAMLSANAIKVVVLAGGDQGSVADTCVAFEDAVGRAALSSPPEVDTTHPLIRVYRRAPGGLTAPVTMTDTDFAGPLAPLGVSAGPVIEGIRPMAGARGFAALLAAIAAGATMVLHPAGQSTPRSTERAA